MLENMFVDVAAGKVNDDHLWRPKFEDYFYVTAWEALQVWE